MTVIHICLVALFAFLTGIYIGGYPDAKYIESLKKQKEFWKASYEKMSKLNMKYQRLEESNTTKTD